MARFQNNPAVVKVVGVGGAGVNAINRMIECGLHGVEFMAINTDTQQLLTSRADLKLTIGRELTPGLGAGADPDIGRRAAEDHEPEIAAGLRGADMVFLIVGQGGGTGTGAAPVVARIAKSLGALAVGVVSLPFGFEGKRRANQADLGVETLCAEADTVIVVPSERLLKMSSKEISVVDAFNAADDFLRIAVQGITDLITTPGYVNFPPQDVDWIMNGTGLASMGVGTANDLVRAVEIALSSPLLERGIEGAHRVLLLIRGANDVVMQEAPAALRLVAEAVSPEAEIFWNAWPDDSLGDECKITLIASRF